MQHVTVVSPTMVPENVGYELYAMPMQLLDVMAQLNPFHCQTQ